MKIKVRDVKPGMTVKFSKYGTSLILAKAGRVEVKYTHLEKLDAFYGPLVGWIDGEKKVEVVTGKRRQKAMYEIKAEVFRSLHDIENVVDMIRLIEAMET